MRLEWKRVVRSVATGTIRLLYWRRFACFAAGLTPMSLSGERVVVVAPHPDDEVIGLGGTLALGGFSDLSLVYCTDGEYADVTLEPCKMASIRRSEAQAVASFLSADLYRLALPERRVHEYLDIGSMTLAAILQSRQPSMICIPFVMDYHIDHVMTNVLVYEALKTIRTCPPPKVLSYAVRVPLVPGGLATHISDVSQSLAVKRHILRELYSSQAKVLGMDRYILVNQVQGILLGKAAAELAWVVPTATWMCAMDTILGDSRGYANRYIPSPRETVFSASHPMRVFLSALNYQRAVMDEVLGHVEGMARASS